MQELEKDTGYHIPQEKVIISQSIPKCDYWGFWYDVEKQLNTQWSIFLFKIKYMLTVTVNIPKYLSQYTQILRRGRHKCQLWLQL